MTWIPDARTDEHYNQKYLNKLDTEYLMGFDWCAEMAVDNFFDNHFDGASDEHLEHLLCEELPEELKDEYEMEFTFYNRDDGSTFVEKRNIETYADLLRYQILEWIEMERNELVTSMIDGMEEKEYEKIKKEVDGQSEA